MPVHFTRLTMAKKVSLILQVEYESDRSILRQIHLLSMTKYFVALLVLAGLIIAFWMLPWGTISFSESSSGAKTAICTEEGIEHFELTSELVFEGWITFIAKEATLKETINKELA